MIFDIQRFSTHDGDGIRTLVFFKGCPLRCRWCENPESQAGGPELLFDPRHCIHCLSCLAPEAGGLMYLGQDGRLAANRGQPTTAPASEPGAEHASEPALAKAAAFGKAAELCPSLALRVAGRRISAREIIAEVMKDEIFFRNSGGGVTFSGGEPLLQPALLLELVTSFTRLGLDCAIETCLAVKPAKLEPFLKLPLTWLVDLKHTDPGVFREGTGGDLSVVLANLESLADAGARMIFRVPVIPGFNDNDLAMGGILAYASRLAQRTADRKPDSTFLVQAAGRGESAGKAGAVGFRPRLHLLPYHDLAAGKYAALSRAYPYERGLSIPKDFIERHAQAGAALGLELEIGG